MGMKTIEDLENIFFFGDKVIPDETFREIKAFIDRSGVLQSQPQIAKRIIEISKNEDVLINDIEKIVSSDPAIAAKILKMANSSFYRLSREVSSIKRAILILGINMIKDIALSIALLDMFKTKGKGLQSLLWDHSIAVSIGAKLISVNFGDEIETDVCFTVGLLHDIGKMMMAKDERYIQVTRAMAQGGPEKALEVERDVFGFNHAELGSVMANLWDFSQEMNYIILNHHDVRALINVDREMLTVPEQYLWNTAIVALADLSAHYIGAGGEKVDVIPASLVLFLRYKSKEFFQETFIEEFKETYFRERSLFD